MSESESEEEESGAEAEGPQATLVYHRGWSESKAVKAALDEKDVAYREREVFTHPLIREEVEGLLSGVEDLRPFLNPRSSEYRDRGMAERTPPFEMAVELMLRDPSLLQLPILVQGERVQVAPVADDAFRFLGVATKPAPKSKSAAKKAAAKKATVT